MVTENLEDSIIFILLHVFSFRPAKVFIFSGKAQALRFIKSEREKGFMSSEIIMKILIGYDGSDCADTALANLQDAGASIPIKIVSKVRNPKKFALPDLDFR